MGHLSGEGGLGGYSTAIAMPAETTTPDPGRGSGDRPERSDPSGDAPLRLGPRIFVPGGSVRIATARSSGPGGQNVNKRSTKVELRVTLHDLAASGMPTPAINRLRRLGKRYVVSGEGDSSADELLITAADARTQKQNRIEALTKLRELVLKALTPPKPRKKTRPSRGAIERRKQEKREHREKKQRRRWSPE
jgi:ribosome-associated protein